MYKFEWNYENINNENDFNNLVEEIKTQNVGVNYEQMARLFYKPENDDDTIMIELQVPTKTMMEITEQNEQPWLDAYKVEDMGDYDASYEVDSTIGCGVIITYKNAEKEMLEYAKSLYIPAVEN